jgi:hypothetical protein
MNNKINSNNLNEQLSFDNRNYMKLNNQNNNLVSSLRERFENKILNESSSSSTKSSIIFSKYQNRNHSPLPSSSSSSSSSSSTPPPIPIPIKQEEEEEEEIISSNNDDDVIQTKVLKQENESNNETNLLNYYKNLNKSINEILFNNFVHKFNYEEKRLKKLIYLKLIKNDDNNCYKFTIDYSESILSLICNKNIINEKIRAIELNNGDNEDDKMIDNDLLIELKTKYLFELNKIIDKKMSNFISKENSVNKKIENNKQNANKVRLEIGEKKRKRDNYFYYFRY